MCCFSIDLVGDMIAMGSENGCIYLFRVTRDGFTFKRQNKIRGSHPLQHLDWSVDGSFLQTVTVDLDLLFCEQKLHFNVSRQTLKYLIFQLFCYFVFKQGIHVHCHQKEVQY